ncbi:mas-related G-protein coupled receptor member H-like [Heteronotia binoei]|uniref:mas-related G-protein coupled receptor member H-like n=1 Tax=Heteronotia binoei TaxID=13085 RepID=UPI0029313CA0|nr:mas-related G-protein coupled receptor member H-like [Heteronotia binoei]
MMGAALEHFKNCNYTYPSFPNVSKNYDYISENISTHNFSENGREESFVVHVPEVISIPLLVICIFGVLGNGIVIWLLGFRIKRNPFITYILNLAVADFGVLLSVIVELLSLRFISSSVFLNIYKVFFFLSLAMYSASQFLLTAISIDRCVAVFFPFWHQCKRPPRSSTIVCALTWALSILLTAMTIAFTHFNPWEKNIGSFCQLILNAVLCLPVMTIAAMALFLKVCLKEQQHRRGKLLTVVCLTLLFFLLFAFPYNVISILSGFNHVSVNIKRVAALLICLNSGVNPVVYFLVGKPWKSRSRESMKIILQKVFKEDKSCTEDTQLESWV